MANYGSNNLIFKIDVSDGGALTAMTNYITEIGGVKVVRGNVESIAFGDTWDEHLLTGIRKMEPFTVGGFYDDTASTGPDVVFNGTHTVTRSVEITWGGTKTTSFEAWITDYERKPVVGDLTMYTATIQPTGTVTEA